jgi:hypothetical protein
MRGRHLDAPGSSALNDTNDDIRVMAICMK